MRNPIDAIVFPNPAFIVLTISAGGRVVKARKTETRKSATNAFSLRLEVRMMIAIILIATRMETVTMLIDIFKIALKDNIKN
jgi:hypothetical protein